MKLPKAGVVSAVLGIISLPLTVVLAWILHDVLREMVITQDSYIRYAWSVSIGGIRLTSGELATALFFAIVVLCVAGTVLGFVGLRQKDASKKWASIGLWGNMAILLLTFLWPIFYALIL